MSRFIHRPSASEAVRWDDTPLPEVKDCPLCGGIPFLAHIGNDSSKKKKIEIHCGKCNLKLVQAAFTYHGWKWLEDITIDLWNTRTSTKGQSFAEIRNDSIEKGHR